MRRRLNVKPLIALLAVVALAAGGVHWLHEAQVGRTLDSLRRRAAVAQAAGEYEKAEQCLSRYLATRPDDVETLGSYALIQARRAGDDRARLQALMTLERTLRLGSKRADVRRRTAELAMRPEIGRFKVAKEQLIALVLETAMRRTPEPEARRRLDAALLDAGRQTTDHVSFTPLEQILGRIDADLMARLGRCWVREAQTGRRDEADDAYRRAAACYRLAVREAPQEIDAYLELARLLRGPLGASADADRLMGEGEGGGLIARNPGSARAHLARALYRREFRLPGASADVAEARRLDPDDPGVILAAAEAAGDEGRSDEAETLLRRGLERFPDDERFYQALAAAASRAGRRDEALDVLRRSVKARPDLPGLQWNLAELMIELGDPEAKDVLTRLRKQAMLYGPTIEFLEARLELSQGRTADAAARLEAARGALASRPDLKRLTAQADLLLARCYDRLLNPARRLAASRRALELEPGSDAARLELASALSALDRPDEALEEFRKAADRSAEARVAVTRLLLARTLRRPESKQRWDEVEQALEQAGKGAEDAVELAVLRSDVLAARNQGDQARAVLSTARSAHPDRVEPWIALAALAERRESAAAALALLDEADAKLGARVELRLARIDYWGRRGGAEALDRLADAGNGLDAFTPLDRNRIEDGLARAFVQRGDFRQAERLWSQLAERTPQDLSTAAKLFDLALQHHDSTNPEALSRAVERLHRIEGDDGVFWRFGEATLLTRKGDPESFKEARALLNEAAELRPDWAPLFLLKGTIAERENQPDHAAEAYLQAVEHGDRRPAFVRRTVELLRLQRRLADADRIAQKWLDESPTANAGSAGRLAAEQALKQGDRKTSLALAARAVPSDSRDYRDHLWLGQLAWSCGDRPRAGSALQRALELDDSVPATWIAWVEYLGRTGRQAEADAAIARAETKLPPDRSALALAQCHLVLGRLDRAETLFQAATAARPNDPETWRVVAECYVRAGRHDKADPCLARLLDPRTQAPEPLVLWARRTRALGLALQGGYPRLREGLALIEANMKVRDDVSDRRAKALLLAKSPGSLAEAIRTLDDLERRQPPTPDEKFVLAQLLESHGDWARSRTLMQSLLAANSDNPLYLATFARSLLRRGQADEAQTWLALLEKALPDHPQTVELQARRLAAAGQGAAAAARLQEYVKGQDNSVYLASFAALLEELGQPDAAEAMFRDSVARSKRPEAVLELADHLSRQGRRSQALALCDQAWSSCRPEAVSQASLRILYRAGSNDVDRRQVQHRLEAAIQSNPDSLNLLFDLANLRTLQGDYEDAAALYRRIHERNRSHDGPLNNLAWLLAAALGKGEEALTVVNQAIALAGPTPDLLDTRAVAYLALKRGDLAIRDLESALATAPTPTMSMHLAQARLLANDHPGATAAFRQAKAAGLISESLHPLERTAYARLDVALAPAQEAKTAAP